MHILSIGSDRNLFVKDSEAQKRIKEYGKLFGGLHIIVFARKNLGLSDMRLDDGVFLYPTNHAFALCYLWNVRAAVKRAQAACPRFSALTAQDSYEAGLAGWLAARRLHIPLQLQIHTDIFSPYFTAESLKNRMRVLLAEFLLPRADGVRVVSERIKQSLKAKNLKLKDEPIVLPVFVDVKKIQSAKVKTDLHGKYPDHDFIILMASRLTREKNIGMAIGAMEKIAAAHPKALLRVVGDGPEKQKLQSQISDHRLQKNIIIESWTGDLISYYKTADLFLLTSNYEGYGRTAVEAMAAGTTVVMTDVGLSGELLINDLDGIVVGVNDHETLAASLLRMREDGEKRRSLGAEALKVVRTLPPKNEYLERYRQSLASLSAETHA